MRYLGVFNDCDYTCNTGSFIETAHGDDCRACLRGQYSDETNTYDQCKTCPDGWVPRGDVTYDGISNDIDSDAGAALNYANRCEQCPSGWSVVTIVNEVNGFTTSMYCSAGSSSCSAGKYLSNGVCEECSAGTYQDQSGQTSCKDCAAGRYQDQSGRTSCKDCAAGRYREQSGWTSCKYCAAGQFQDQLGQTSCKDCAAGQFQDQISQTSCKDCAAGRYQDQLSQTSCKDCAAGQFQDQLSQTSCKTCPSGWDSEAGQSSCTNPNANPCDGAGLESNGDFCYAGEHENYGNRICSDYAKFAFGSADEPKSATHVVGGGLSNPADARYVACPANKDCDGYGLTEDECRQLCIATSWCDAFNYGKNAQLSSGHRWWEDSSGTGRCGLYKDCDLQHSNDWWVTGFNYVPLDCRSTKGVPQGHRCGPGT